MKKILNCLIASTMALFIVVIMQSPPTLASGMEKVIYVENPQWPAGCIFSCDMTGLTNDENANNPCNTETEEVQVANYSSVNFQSITGTGVGMFNLFKDVMVILSPQVANLAANNNMMMMKNNCEKKEVRYILKTPTFASLNNTMNQYITESKFCSEVLYTQKIPTCASLNNMMMGITTDMFKGWTEASYNMKKPLTGVNNFNLQTVATTYWTNGAIMQLKLPISIISCDGLTSQTAKHMINVNNEMFVSSSFISSISGLNNAGTVNNNSSNNNMTRG
jgi:hypothetical protein